MLTTFSQQELLQTFINFLKRHLTDVRIEEAPVELTKSEFDFDVLPRDVSIVAGADPLITVVVSRRSLPSASTSFLKSNSFF